MAYLAEIPLLLAQNLLTHGDHSVHSEETTQSIFGGGSDGELLTVGLSDARDGVGVDVTVDDVEDEAVAVEEVEAVLDKVSEEVRVGEIVLVVDGVSEQEVVGDGVGVGDRVLDGDSVRVTLVVVVTDTVMVTVADCDWVAEGVGLTVPLDDSVTETELDGV